MNTLKSEMERIEKKCVEKMHSSLKNFHQVELYDVVNEMVFRELSITSDNIKEILDKGLKYLNLEELKFRSDDNKGTIEYAINGVTSEIISEIIGNIKDKFTLEIVEKPIKNQPSTKDDKEEIKFGLVESWKSIRTYFSGEELTLYEKRLEGMDICELEEEKIYLENMVTNLNNTYSDV